MKKFDKKGWLDRIDDGEEIVLELGCGSRKRHRDAIGIDLKDYPGVDIVGDALDILKRFPNNSVSAVYSYHFFEHLEEVTAYMTELNRIMKQDGSLQVVTPHFSNPYYYSDPTHRTHYGLYSFAYFCGNVFFRRQVPRYDQDLDFELVDVELIFKSAPPFVLRWGIKKLFQFVFNINRYMMELYEENFCYLIPCYEIRYVLAKRE